MIKQGGILKGEPACQTHRAWHCEKSRETKDVGTEYQPLRLTGLQDNSNLYRHWYCWGVEQTEFSMTVIHSLNMIIVDTKQTHSSPTCQTYPVLQL